MQLTPQEKAHVAWLINFLIDADEPETMLSCLKRIADRKAFNCIQPGRVDRGEAERWSRLSEALSAVETKLKQAA